MKHTLRYFLAIMAFSMIMACDHKPLADEQVDSNDEILFCPRVAIENIETGEEPWTKGKPLDNKVDMLPSMSIFCYVTKNVWATDGPITKPNKMNNVPLYSRRDERNTYWEYEEGNRVTWQGVQNGANVAFFGYSPVATEDNGLSIISDFSGSASGAPILRYKVLRDIRSQPDLHIAVPIKDMMRTINPIILIYRRAMTNIGITLSGSGQKVKALYLTGISRQGDISLDINAIDTLRWSNLAPISTEVEDRLYIPLPESVPMEINSLTQITNPDGYLMMIPQKLGPEAKVVVELDGEADRCYSLVTDKKNEWSVGTLFQYDINLDLCSHSVTPNNWFDAPASGGSIKVLVVGNGPWTSKVEGEGLSIWPTSSRSKDQEVIITWDANTSVVELGKRYGTVTFIPSPGYEDNYGSIEFHTAQVGHMPEWIEYNGVKWAKGNLIANGANSCKIGDPTDAGLYFRFGSLVGIKGGKTGDGKGRVDPSFSETYWNGATVFDPDNELAVYPAEMLAAGGSGKPAQWNNPDLPQVNLKEPSTWYFNHAAFPYDDNNTYWNPNLVSFRTYSGIVSGKWAKIGVGDPCTYYLGEDWETPTRTNWHSLCNYAEGNPWLDPSLVGAEINSDVALKENIYFANRMICLPISGARGNYAGKFTGLNKKEAGGSPYTQYWAAEVLGCLGAWTLWYQWDYDRNNNIDIDGGNRTAAFPVRCVYNK